MFSTLFATASAQETAIKPALIPITINEETNDPKAAAIVKKLIDEHIKRNNLEDIVSYSAIYAHFIPLQKKGAEDKFIIAQIMEPPAGCYASGCSTRIYHSKDGKVWKGVFSAFVHGAWYDDNSRGDKPANLIFTSNTMNKNPGVWMWGGSAYFLANKAK